MKKLLMLTSIAIATACAQDIAGDWHGTLSAGGASLRLALHIQKTDSGAYTGSMDSLDQGANGLPLSSITFKDSAISFQVEAVHGSYEGKLSADRMAGSWTQGQAIPLAFERGSFPQPKAAQPSDIDGTWAGTLDTGAMKLRLVFHITNTGSGLTATLDSPDQGAKGIPVTTATRSGSSLKLELKQMAGLFAGTIDKDLQSISGTWSQGGGSLPLTLKRVKDAAELDRRRPQTPVPPFPYHSEDVTYANPAAAIQLAATFTIPAGKGPFPAVVLIPGSGPHDRNETLMGHQPFLVLADYLSRNGIAVLRADDRGVGQSGGKFAGATTADLATDAESSFTYLKSRPEADPHKIGLIGHSEGGLIAPMVAARNHDVAFVVMLAGPGLPGDQILAAQSKLIAQAMGMPAEQVEKQTAINHQLYALVKTDTDPAALDQKLHALLAPIMPEAQADSQSKILESPWMQYFLRYDPAPALRNLTCPVLALNGSKDLQVPPAINLPAIRQALTQAGNKNFEVDELPGLNHLFQTATTGAPSEYSEIEETLSPIALAKIAAWIHRNFSTDEQAN